MMVEFTKQMIYGVVDARFFNADTIAATAGVSHTYEAMRDLVFNFYGNYTRQTDIFNSALQFNNGAIGPPATPNVNIPLIVNPFGTTPGVNPIAYNQFTGRASVTKTIDQAFVTLSGTVFDILYDHSDNVPFPFQTSHDGASFWISGRVGYNFTPAFYVFAQGDGIFQRFSNSVFNTNGYRVIGGIGSNDQRSLFRGEVYGGYWAQNQQEGSLIALGIPTVIGLGIPTDFNSGVFGGRLSYFPTRYWSIVAQVDQTLGMSTTPVALNSGGNSYPNDYCYPADHLWNRAGLVGRRPRRLHARRIHWRSGAKQSRLARWRFIQL